MTPWEQHSAVISIPRFDYDAPSSLLHHSHSGFLITCPISLARKAPLKKQSPSTQSTFSNNSGNEENSVSKRRKISEENVDGDCGNGSEGDVEEGACSTVKVNTDGETGPLLKLVKLTKSGLLLFVFGKSVSPDVVGIVLRIVQSGESGSSASLLEEEVDQDATSKLYQVLKREERRLSLNCIHTDLSNILPIIS